MARSWQWFGTVAVLAATVSIPARAAAEILEVEGCVAWSAQRVCVVKQRCWNDASLGAWRCVERDVREESESGSAPTTQRQGAIE